jgi:iron complex outermembrane receptor protein
LSLSWGLEHRWENFSTRPGDPLAYVNGGYIYPAGYGAPGVATSVIGKPAQVGAQGAITLVPGDAADTSRDVFAAYVEASVNLTEAWLVDLAGRTEHYSDVGKQVFSGKLSTRYEITDWLAIRGTVSNGFRAPSLAQEGFAQTSSQLFAVNGVTTVIPTKTVPVASPLAAALGATPLTPETSRDFSVGLSLTPLSNLTVTVDAYDIRLDHRIMLTGFLSGTAVNNILANAGFSPTYVKYFANAMDTDTEGVDLVATYETSMGEIDSQDVHLSLSGSFNYNHSEVTALPPTPPELAGLGFNLYDAQTIGSVTKDLPLTKAILSESLSWNSFDFNLRETGYGPYSDIRTAPTPSQTFKSNYLIDVSARYRFSDKAAFTLGVDNVFNQYPGKSIITNTTGSPIYAGDSPYGFYGGYYYARASYDF